ncbi:hypothetical protein HDV05_002287 [Chytridiales sp. JEL 0842]|nr:hypothetical protein HDV05_002287 [Chytridiales sp. JEL 0842]
MATSSTSHPTSPTNPIVPKTITNSFITDGLHYTATYYDSPTFPTNHLSIHQAYGVCFNNKGKVLIAKSKNGHYTLVGGGVEHEKLGESVVECLKREVVEETNHGVLEYVPIGYQRVIEGHDQQGEYFQVRFACLVEKLGEFVEDGDGMGSIVAIEEVSIDEVNGYLKWGEIGDLIARRATEVWETRWKSKARE